jgi:mono/diheme cytochrome c family protein
MEMVVALGLPVVVGGVLLALPFVDRGADRSPRARLPYLGVLGAGMLGFAALTAVSVIEDARDPAMAERTAESRRQADLARALALEHGVPAAGGTAVYTLAPHYRARALFAEHCAACHVGESRDAPELSAGYNSREWIRDFLRDPNGDRFFGRTDMNRMKPVELEGAEFEAVVEFVYAETGAPDADAALAARGAQLVDETDCADCHERDGETPSSPGPNLGGRGTVDYLVEFIGNPADRRFFGRHDQMGAFAYKLTEGERRALAEYLVWMRDASAEDLEALEVP